MAMEGRLVVCAVGGIAGPLELPDSRFAPERSMVSGGERSLYEVAVGAAALGWDVELRGAINRPIFEELCSAAGSRPSVGFAPRRPSGSDVVVVPEATDPGLFGALHLSGSRTVVYLLAPPGLWGWSFLTGWVPSNPDSVSFDAVGTPDMFRALGDMGLTLWTNAHGTAQASHRAGVPIEWLGTGTPVPFPDPPEKTVDVAIVAANRWIGVARRIVAKLGLNVVEVPAVGNNYTLCTALGPARILVWPSRIEGMSRIAREARAVGTVPVALNTNPFTTRQDHGEGVVLVDDIDALGREAITLLGDPGRLAELREKAVLGARAQADWAAFLARLSAALDSIVAGGTRPAAFALGCIGDDIHQRWTGLGRAHDRLTAVYADTVTQVESMKSAAWQARSEIQQKEAELSELRNQLEKRTSELQSLRASTEEELEAYRRRRSVRLANRLPRGRL
jgi:hypothetical protein